MGDEAVGGRVWRSTPLIPIGVVGLVLVSSCTFGTPGRSYQLRNECSRSIEASWSLFEDRPIEPRFSDVLGPGEVGLEFVDLLPNTDGELVVNVWVRSADGDASWDHLRLDDADLAEPVSGDTDREIVIAGELCPEAN